MPRVLARAVSFAASPFNRPGSLRRTPIVLAVLVACGTLWPRPAGAQGINWLVSVSSSGIPGDGSSSCPFISRDGRYVAFETLSTNFAPAPPGVYGGLFLHDRQTGVTELVVLKSSGLNGCLVLSADARFVAFDSSDSLVPGDTNYRRDVFVRDRVSQTTTRVSVGALGVQGNGDSGVSALSADGRFVGFTSWASNLVPGDTNGTYDAFVHDRVTGVTTRVSVDSSGAQALFTGMTGPFGTSVNAISADGRFVAMESDAPNLVAGDTNGETDVFVHDRATGATTRISVSSTGTEGNDDSGSGSISGDGRYIAFSSWASNLAPESGSTRQVFLHDRQTGLTTLVSVQAESESFSAAISEDGRIVAFTSLAYDTDGHYDVFVRDLAAGTTTRVSELSDGTEADGWSHSPALSGDGRYVAFRSEAFNLLWPYVKPQWQQFHGHIFVQDRLGGCTFEAGASPEVLGPAGGSGTVTIVTGADCSWSARSKAAPYLVLGPSLGRGSALLPYTVAPHDALAPRVLEMTVAGGSLAITQRGSLVPGLDWNGDGFLDLLWHHQGDGRLSTWLMNGVGIATGPPLTPDRVPDVFWKAVGTGDLDGDGRADIVWQNVADGRVSVWFMEGLAAREGVPLTIPQVADTRWRICSVGDLNGDGHADLVWQHQAYGYIAAWLMDGATVLLTTTLDVMVPDPNWRIVGSVDFNGNGSRDLVWHHQLDGRLAVWFMDGLSVVSTASMAPGAVPDTSWEVRAVGDLNADGYPDLIWQNVRDGRVSVWWMRGLAAYSGDLIGPTVADTRWRIVGPR